MECQNIKPFFSVIIPVYNSVEYILRSVNSVLSQTYKNFELIIVDDGSTDGSGDVIYNINDFRIKLVRQNNAGVSSARNRGIIEAKGEYVAFLDADDEWDCTFLDVIVELIILYPDIGMYTTGFNMVFEKGPNVEVTISGHNNNTFQLVHDYFWKAAGNAFIHTSGVVIPHHVFLEIGMFGIGVTQGEDLEMWARVALRYPIAYDSRILFTFYQTGIKGKPRFSEYLRFDPVLLLLKNYGMKSNNNLVADRDIKLYMIHHFRRICWSIIKRKNRDATVNYINYNDIRFYGLSGSMIKKSYFFWLGLRLFSLIVSIRHSRFMLRLLSNNVETHNVIQRIPIITDTEIRRT